MLPLIIYSIATEYRYAEAYIQFQPHVYLTTAYLVILLFLHAFWFYLFIKIILNVINTGTSEDLQQNVVTNAEDKKKEE